MSKSDLYRLPTSGGSYEEVLNKVKALRKDMTPDQAGKLAATTFQGHDEMKQVTHDAFAEFMDWNGLFTFREPPAAKRKMRCWIFASI